MTPSHADDTATWEAAPPSDPVVVGDLVDSVLGKIAHGSPGSILVLRAAWRDVAGVRLADRCAPVGLEGGVLTVEAADGGTISLLRFEAENIARRAADVCSEPITDVKFRVRRRERGIS